MDKDAFPSQSLCIPCTFTKSGRAKNHRGVDLISDALPFGGLWYLEVDDAVDYAKHRSRAHRAVIRVYDEAANVIEIQALNKLRTIPFLTIRGTT